MIPDHTQLLHTTLGRTPLDEWSARSRNLYLTTHNTHKRWTSMYPAAFEPTIPASKRPQIHVVDSAVAGIGSLPFLQLKNTQIQIYGIYQLTYCFGCLKGCRNWRGTLRVCRARNWTKHVAAGEEAAECNVGYKSVGAVFSPRYRIKWTLQC